MSLHKLNINSCIRFVAVLLGLLTFTVAQASEEVRVDFECTVSSTSSLLSIPMGAEVNGFFLYGTDATDGDPDPTAGRYSGTMVDAGVTVASYSGAFDAGGSFNSTNFFDDFLDPPSDRVSLTSPMTSNTVDGFSMTSMKLGLTDSTTTAFDSDALQTSYELSEFDGKIGTSSGFNSVQLSFSDGSSSTGVQCAIDSLTAAVEEATFDITLDIKTANPTSINTVTYKVDDLDVTATTPGADATSPVSLVLTDLSEGVHLLRTSFGILKFELDASGVVTSLDTSKMTVDGTTLTIQNAIDFPTLRINALNPTSINNVSLRLQERQFLTDIGTTQTIPGTDVQTGVTFPFEGMVGDMKFRILGSFNTEIGFELDASGNLTPLRDRDVGKFTFSGNTLTIQNTISFPTLTIKAANPTSMTEAAFKLQERHAFHDIGTQQRIPATEVQSGVTFPFEGMLADQHFRTLGCFNTDISFILDESGNLTPRSARDQGKFTFSDNTIVIQNNLDQRVRIFTESATTQSPVSVVFRAFRADCEIGSASISGSEMPTGVEFPMLGMLGDQDFQVGTSVGNPLFRLLPDGTAMFFDPVLQLTPLKGGLPIEDGGNTLFIELLPANRPPEIDAGSNRTILSSEQSSTVLSGTASDPDGDALTCRWLQGTSVLVGPVAISGTTCDLALGNLDPLGTGSHTFTLEVTDDIATVTDNVVVTVENSPPVAAPAGGGVFQIGADTEVTLGGQVADHDGDTLSFEWRLGGTALFPADTISAPFGGDSVTLPEQTVSAQTLGLGTHVVELAVSDGVNAEVVEAINVEVVDTEAPAIALVPSTTILWPPNHKMVEVTVQANVSDNSGSAVALSVAVESSEPPEYDGDGNFLPDHEVVSVDQISGLIVLNLRSERSGKGDGRTYTVTVEGTDDSGNTSAASVDIQAPHSRKP